MKAFEKQIKTIEDQGKKHVDGLESLKPKEQTKAITYKSDNDDIPLLAKKFIVKCEKKEWMKY